MPNNEQIETHQTWQEAAGIGLGVVAALSPWLTGHLDNSTIVSATAAAGIVVLLMSCVKLMVASRAEDAAMLLAGLWLLAGPFVLGYAGTTLGMLHLLVGAVISALAALQFRQDRNSSDRNLARHGG